MNLAGDVQLLVSRLPPVRVTLGEVRHFAKPDADVVYVSVHSPDLEELHRLLADNLPHHDSHPEYTPHVTIARVRPGCGARHDGDRRFAGVTLELDELTFSAADGQRCVLRLNGSRAAEKVRAGLALAGVGPQPHVNGKALGMNETTGGEGGFTVAPADYLNDSRRTPGNPPAAARGAEPGKSVDALDGPAYRCEACGREWAKAEHGYDAADDFGNPKCPGCGGRVLVRGAGSTEWAEGSAGAAAGGADVGQNTKSAAGWDENKHPRDHGKFSSKPGAGGGTEATDGHETKPAGDAGRHDAHAAWAERDAARGKAQMLLDMAEGQNEELPAEAARRQRAWSGAHDTLTGEPSAANAGAAVAAARHWSTVSWDDWSLGESQLREAGATDGELAGLTKARARAERDVGRRLDAYAGQAAKLAEAEAARAGLEAREPQRPDDPDEPDEADYRGDEPEEPDEPDYNAYPEGEDGDASYQADFEAWEKDHDAWQADHDAWEEAGEKYEADREAWEGEVERIDEAYDKAVDRWGKELERAADRVTKESDRLNERYDALQEASDQADIDVADAIADAAQAVRDRLDEEEENDPEPEEEAGAGEAERGAERADKAQTGGRAKAAKLSLTPAGLTEAVSTKGVTTDTAAALAAVGEELATRTEPPRPMPGYGQIYSDEGRVWYVGGDGDEDGLAGLAEEKVREAYPGCTEFVYEAEAFPPEGENWVRVYPRGGRKARKAVGGHESHAPTAAESDPEAFAELAADILYGIYGERAIEALHADDGEADDDKPHTKAWDPKDHPRGKGGRFIPKGSAEAVSAARETVSDALKGGKADPKRAADVLSHLNLLTVKQLKEIHKEHGVWAPGPLRAQLIEGIKARLERAAPPGTAAAAPAEPWAGGKPEPGKVYNAPTDQLHVDPSRFQYKLNVDKAAGVGQELKSVTTWNPDFAGVVSVWQDPADGKTYVVNGHHRRELAGRLGVEDMAVRYVKADSAKQARAVGALINIAEGRGTAVDAAKFMRDSGVAPEDMAKHGVSLKGKLAADAATLTRLSDRAFDRLARGTLDETKALAVAKHLEDHDLQDQLFGLLEKREDEGKDLSPRVIEEMAREMAQTPKATTTEHTLFGDIESEQSLFVERNEVKASVRAELAKEVNDFLAVSSRRRAERVGQAGNVLDVEANRKIAEEADRVRNVFDTLVNRKGPISDAVNEAAAQYAKAKTKRERDAVRARATEAVREAVFREAGVGQQQPASGGGGQPAADGRGEGGGAGGGSAAAGAQPGAGGAAVPGDGGRGAAGAAGLTEADTPAVDTPASEPQPPEPGFTGIDSHGHKWENGRQVARGEVEGAAQSNAVRDDAVRGVPGVRAPVADERDPKEAGTLRRQVQKETHKLEDVAAGKYPVGVEGRGGKDAEEARRRGLYTADVNGVSIYARSKEDAQPLVDYLEGGGKYGTPEFSRLLGYTPEQVSQYERFLAASGQTELLTHDEGRATQPKAAAPATRPEADAPAVDTPASRPAGQPKAPASEFATSPEGSTFGDHDPQGPIELEGQPLRHGDWVAIQEPGMSEPVYAPVAHAHRDHAADATGRSSGSRVTIRPSARGVSEVGGPRPPSEVSSGFVRRATHAEVAAAARRNGKPAPAGIEAHESAAPQHHPAKVRAALDRFANRSAHARGGGLFGGEDMQARAGFARLPDGAPVVFTDGEFAGRTGRVVRDATQGNRVVAEVDGRPGLVPISPEVVEPLSAAQSWRTEASQAPMEQHGMFNAGHFLPNRGRASLADGGVVRKYITHDRRRGKWVVHAESGRVLGEHDTEEDAKRQLAAIESHKHDAKSAGWDESKHPRADDGKFGEGAGHADRHADDAEADYERRYAAWEAAEKRHGELHDRLFDGLHGLVADADADTRLSEALDVLKNADDFPDPAAEVRKVGAELRADVATGVVALAGRLEGQVREAFPAVKTAPLRTLAASLAEKLGAEAEAALAPLAERGREGLADARRNVGRLVRRLESAAPRLADKASALAERHVGSLEPDYPGDAAGEGGAAGKSLGAEGGGMCEVRGWAEYVKAREEWLRQAGAPDAHQETKPTPQDA